VRKPVSESKPSDKTIAAPDEHEEESEDEEESSESESEDDQFARQVLIKPTFVPKKARETLLAKERQEEEAALADQLKQQQLEERRRESHNIVAEAVKRDVLGDEGAPIKMFVCSLNICR
jgi:microfibrillar-associated protein 1